MFESISFISAKSRDFMRRAGDFVPGQDRIRRKPVTPRFSPKLMDRLGRPLCDTTPERAACQALFHEGRDLARQECWDRLSAMTTASDLNRIATRAGTPAAELLAAGARSDLSHALYSASDAGVLTSGHRMLAGLCAMDEAAAEHADSPVCASIVALSHMDAGWAWYRQGWQRGRPEQHLDAFRAAFHHAEEVLSPFCPKRANSPLLAATRCALLAGLPDADDRVVSDYETLINLAPRMPGHMRAYGLHLLPRWFGSHAALDLAARQIAARTGYEWGAGGYAWVYLDALLQDPSSFAMLDMDYFTDAVADILKRHPGQHTTNLFAASLSRMLDNHSVPGPDRTQRRALAQMRDKLVRKNMTETHGWVWSVVDIGYGTPGSDHTPDTRSTEAEKGTHRAWEVISTVLSRDLQRLQGEPTAAP